MDRLRVYTLRELMALQTPEILFLIEPRLLAAGGNMFIYGKQETWKSWIALDMAFAVSMGTKWLGVYETRKSPVLILQTEQTEHLYRERVMDFTRHLNGSKPLDNLRIATDMSIGLDNPFGLGILEAALIEHKPALLILDNLYHVLERLASEDNPQKFIKGIGALQQKYNTAICIITHTRKTTSEEFERMADSDDDDIESMFGSAKFLWWADTSVRVLKSSHDDHELTLRFKKTKNAKYHVPDIGLRAYSDPVRLSLR